MTEIRRVDLKAVASQELKALAEKELEIKDPENAREIVELCCQYFENTCEKC